MITLHKKESHAASQELEKMLNDLVIAYSKEIHPKSEPGLPYIVEDGTVYKTEDEIQKWLQELSDELSWQRSLSGDGCYIDPNEGQVC